jgi:hypothetical protein
VWTNPVPIPPYFPPLSLSVHHHRPRFRLPELLLAIPTLPPSSPASTSLPSLLPRFLPSLQPPVSIAAGENPARIRQRRDLTRGAALKRGDSERRPATRPSSPRRRAFSLSSCCVAVLCVVTKLRKRACVSADFSHQKGRKIDRPTGWSAAREERTRGSLEATQTAPTGMRACYPPPRLTRLQPYRHVVHG